MTAPVPIPTPIEPAALVDAGYREFPPSRIDKAARMFQRRFEDKAGTRYFLNFRMWDNSEWGHGISFDAEMSGETNTGGHVWITIKEASIQATEARAEILWKAAGSCYYERDAAHAK